MYLHSMLFSNNKTLIIEIYCEEMSDAKDSTAMILTSFSCGPFTNMDKR